MMFIFYIISLISHLYTLTYNYYAALLLGGGRILRRTLSVRLSVRLSDRPSRYCFCLLFLQ